MHYKAKTITALIFFALFRVSLVYAAPKVATEADIAPIEYVVPVPGLKAGEIFDGTKLWIAENFRSAKHVIDLEDRGAGLIVGNGILPNVMLKSGFVTMPLEAEFKVKVEIKDGKMRLTFSHFKIASRSSSMLWKQEADQIRPRLAAFGGEIAKYLGAPKNSDF